MVSTPVAKPKPKGQRVKTFTYHVPQADGSHEQTTVVVYLNAEAFFVIYPGEHVAQVIGQHARKPDAFNAFEGHVASRTFEGARDAAKSCWTLYENILKESGKAQVLLISFKANRMGEGDHVGVGDRPSRISFCANQAVQFHYQKVWRSGDQLYSQRSAAEPLRFLKNISDVRGQPGSRSYGSEWYMVEWTQEREDFLASIDAALADLIARLSGFFGHGDGTQALLENLDRAVAGGTSPLALPAPAKES